MYPSKNLAFGTVATAPSPATSGTSLVLTAGQGSRFPDPATVGNYLITVQEKNKRPDPTNAEICLVTGLSTDTLTITRAQGGSSARTIIATDEVYMGIYSENVVELQNAIKSSPLVTQVFS